MVWRESIAHPFDQAVAAAIAKDLLLARHFAFKVVGLGAFSAFGVKLRGLSKVKRGPTSKQNHTAPLVGQWWHRRKGYTNVFAAHRRLQRKTCLLPFATGYSGTHAPEKDLLCQGKGVIALLMSCSWMGYLAKHSLELLGKLRRLRQISYLCWQRLGPVDLSVPFVNTHRMALTTAQPFFEGQIDVVWYNSIICCVVCVLCSCV